MQANDIVMVYTDPTEQTRAEGKAKLLTFIERIDHLEQWWVEFLDLPGMTFKRLIKCNEI